MKRSRRFQPSSLQVLEGRIVLSHIIYATADLSNLSGPPANVAQTLTPSDMVPGAPQRPPAETRFRST